MKSAVLICLLLLFHWVGSSTPRDRAIALVDRLALDEMLTLVRGVPGPYIGNVKGNQRMGIPELHLQDGPQGVGDGLHGVTCWPSALSVVSSWNRTTMYRYGKLQAIEQRGKGTNILLGPMVNIARVYQGGRNFESFGEDPYLAGVMAQQIVQGIQSEPMIATVKHFAFNNQEIDRTTVSANLSDRTEHEIYLPAFEAAVAAGVAYNRINNTYACENDRTLNQILKGELGFQGFVMADWGATHSTIDSALHGLDMEMPDDKYFGIPLLEAVKRSQVPISRIRDMAVRILTPMFAVGLMDTPPVGNISAVVTNEKHRLAATEIIGESSVLAKNSGNLLPLNLDKLRKIAIIGDGCKVKPVIAGGGSGRVIADTIDTVYQAFAGRAGSRYEVTYSQTSPLQVAIENARSADVAILCVSTWSEEGHDRSSLEIDSEETLLIDSIAAVQPKTIVLLSTVGATVMPWFKSVPAVLLLWMPGQGVGTAVYNLVSGIWNPSGRAPISFPIKESDTPLVTKIQYPGVNLETDYLEGLDIGYRWFLSSQVLPLLPFGFGLSYSTFNYSNLRYIASVISYFRVDCDLCAPESIEVRLDVMNTAGPAGADVIQLYIEHPVTAQQPSRILRRFEKVNLEPKASRTIRFHLSERDFSSWLDGDWRITPGTFIVSIGASAGDIRLQTTLRIQLR